MNHFRLFDLNHLRCLFLFGNRWLLLNLGLLLNNFFSLNFGLFNQIHGLFLDCGRFLNLGLRNLILFINAYCPIISIITNVLINCSRNICALLDFLD